MKVVAVALFHVILTGSALLAQPDSVGERTNLLSGFTKSIEALAGASHPAVVQIMTEGRGLVSDDDGTRAGLITKQQTTGSGVIVDSDGYIITNAHVVKNARHIHVSVMKPRRADAMDEYSQLPAKIVGLDQETDLAVLKVEAKNLPVLALSNSQRVTQGQLVIALGSPMGLENSLTVGFISAPVRYLGDDSRVAFIQTDAPINPGNSGGPLLDIEGRVVGINTMIISRSGGNEGIGFAIPSPIVAWVYQRLRKYGHIRRGEIGVAAEDITPVLASALNLSADTGVILSDVAPRSAAEAAGLQPGDIVLAADGKPIRKSRELIDVVSQHLVGEQIAFEVQHGSNRYQKTVAVLEAPRSIDDLANLASREAHLVRQLGILALTIDEKVTPILPDLRRLSGVVVAGIPVEFAGLNPGLLAGDAIYQLNGADINSLADLRAAIDKKPTGAPMALQIERDGQLIFVSFHLN
jgi:serine protease Do